MKDAFTSKLGKVPAFHFAEHAKSFKWVCCVGSLKENLQSSALKNAGAQHLHLHLTTDKNYVRWHKLKVKGVGFLKMECKSD